MKINMKEEIRKVVIKEYVACDGKVFATEQGCLDHDAQDVETINAWVDRWEDNPNRKTLTENDIGRTILLVYEEYYGYEKSEFCDVVFYEEDILRDVQRALDYINGVGI